MWAMLANFDSRSLENHCGFDWALAVLLARN